MQIQKNPSIKKGMDIYSGTTQFQKKSWLVRARQVGIHSCYFDLLSPSPCDIFLDFSFVRGFKRLNEVRGRWEEGGGGGEGKSKF